MVVSVVESVVESTYFQQQNYEKEYLSRLSEYRPIQVLIRGRKLEPVA